MKSETAPIQNRTDGRSFFRSVADTARATCLSGAFAGSMLASVISPTYEFLIGAKAGHLLLEKTSLRKVELGAGALLIGLGGWKVGETLWGEDKPDKPAVGFSESFGRSMVLELADKTQFNNILVGVEAAAQGKASGKRCWAAAYAGGLLASCVNPIYEFMLGAQLGPLFKSHRKALGVGAGLILMAMGISKIRPKKADEAEAVTTMSPWQWFWRGFERGIVTEFTDKTQINNMLMAAEIANAAALQSA